MAAFYEVKNGVIGNRISRKEVEARGLERRIDITIAYRNAVKFSKPGPDSPMEAVMIFEADGDNFTGCSAH